MDKKKAISQILTTLEIEALLREGKLDQAYDQLNLLLEREPGNSYAWYLLGGIYRRQQLWGDAINAYNKAKMIDPKDRPLRLSRQFTKFSITGIPI